MKKIVENQILEGERAGFSSKEIIYKNCIFVDGESPLKESSSLEVDGCTFKYKYPLWYSKDIVVKNTTFELMSRSGIWYTKNIEVINSKIDAPKEFRRSENIKIIDTDFSIAEETLWGCKNIYIKNSHIKGDYVGMNSKKVYLENVLIDGNYCFDGGEDIEAHNSIFNSKDSFWNAKNVTIYDSTIIGEYLSWNSKNVTFINCKLESHQGLCYMDNVKLINCSLLNSDLTFEYSKRINATINSKVNSIKNPYSGKIKVKGCDELILDPKFINPKSVKIEVEDE